MKKLISFVFLFVTLSAFLVEAGDVLRIDFSKQNQYIIGLKVGDMAEFYLNGERNAIIADKIKPYSADVTVFVALNTGNHPQYVTLSNERSLKLDIERDDVDDLYISWYKSDENYAYLLLKRPEITTLTGNIVGNDEIKRNKREYDKYLILGFCIFITITIILLIFKYKKKKIE